MLTPVILPQPVDVSSVLLDTRTDVSSALLDAQEQEFMLIYLNKGVQLQCLDILLKDSHRGIFSGMFSNLPT